MIEYYYIDVYTPRGHVYSECDMLDQILMTWYRTVNRLAAVSTELVAHISVERKASAYSQ